MENALTLGQSAALLTAIKVGIIEIAPVRWPTMSSIGSVMLTVFRTTRRTSGKYVGHVRSSETLLFRRIESAQAELA